MKSTFIFLLTHGLWGQELLVSTKMVIGEFQDVLAFPLMPDTKLETYTNSIQDAMERLPGYDFLFLTDIPGGSPYNVSAAFLAKSGVEVVSGLSMNLLISAIELRTQYPCDQLSGQLVAHMLDAEAFIYNMKQFLED